MISNITFRGYIVCEKDRVIKNKVQNFAGHKTECLINASWSHENMFECWGAPSNVTVTGNLEVRKGSTFDVSCSYGLAIPEITKVKYCVDDFCSTQGIKTMLNLSMSVDLNDDGKNVTCQPLSMFTDLNGYSNEGISPVRRLNVICEIC